MAKYLDILNGNITRQTPISTSSGASDANKIPQTNADGYIDTTLLDPSIGANTLSFTAYEALSAGNFVNIFVDGGATKVRKADASHGVTYKADGYVKTSVSSGATAVVYFDGKNSSLIGLTAGEIYFLSSTAGGVTLTPTLTTNYAVQEIGKAISATELIFEPKLVITA